MSLQVKTERGTAEVGLRSSAAMEVVILPLIYEPDGTEIHMSIDKVTVKSTAEELLPQKWRCAEISLCKERRSRGRSPRAFARPHEGKRRRPATTAPRSVVVASVVHGGAASTGSTKLLSPAMMPGNTVPFASASIRAAVTICRGVGWQQVTLVVSHAWQGRKDPSVLARSSHMFSPVRPHRDRTNFF